MTKLRERILKLRAEGMKPRDIAKKLKCTPSYVYNVKQDPEDKFDKFFGLGEYAKLDPPVTQDAVNHPSHYTVGGVETIDYIEAKQLGYNLGNAVKYISRAQYKGKHLEDLRKALWYVQREINKLESQGESK